VLQQFYHFQWALIGNLGVDLLVIPLSKLFGLEPATKLIILLIPSLTAAGLLWVAREVHGRIPPTAFFALPLVYSFPFMFGFVNSALATAFALLAFAYWLRLARLGRLRLRAIVFVPLSLIIWVTHTFGWGTLGVLAFSAELVRQLDLRRGFFHGGFKAALHCLSLVPPVLLMLAWRSGEHVTGRTSDWFNWPLKLDWMLMVLRDRWQVFDQASLALIGAVLLLGLVLRQKLEYSRNLVASALFLALVYICLPRVVFGSAYADMRLAPTVIAIAVIAIRYRPAWAGKTGSMMAAAGLLFLAVRIGGNTVSFWHYDRAFDRELAAIPHIPRNARLISFVGARCDKPWAMSRLEHLPALALVRRNAFSNEQWSMAGAQLLTVRYPGAPGWRSDPSEVVVAQRCKGEYWRPVDQSLRGFPRGAFDYVWLISPPPVHPQAPVGLQPLWRDGPSVLYRVVDRTQPPPWPRTGK
jgi:hypothetical protein